VDFSSSLEKVFSSLVDTSSSLEELS